MAGMAIIAGMSYLFGYSAGSKRDVPVKRVNYDLNAAHADASKLRAGLIRIRNHFAGQKSGSAVKAHRMAKEALK
jgi:hypothetical protein